VDAAEHSNVVIISLVRQGRPPGGEGRCLSEVAGVAAGELPLVGEAVPPTVGVHVRNPGGESEPLEADLDAVRRERASAACGEPQVRQIGASPFGPRTQVALIARAGFGPIRTRRSLAPLPWKRTGSPCRSTSSIMRLPTSERRTPVL